MAGYMKRALKTKEAGVQAITAILWRRLREGGFILLSALAIFLFVALITHSAADPGWSKTAHNRMIVNAAGKMGAFFADLFLFLFGYIAYMFPVMIAYGGLSVFRNRLGMTGFHRLLWILRFAGFVAAVASGTALASMHFNTLSAGMPFSAGGILGQLVMQPFVPAFGLLGATLLLLAIFLAGTTITTGLSWFGLMDRLGHGSVVLFFETKRNIEVLFSRFRHPKLNDRKSLMLKEKPKRMPLFSPTEKAVDRELQILPSMLSPPKRRTAFSTELPAITLLEENNEERVEGFSKQKLEALTQEVEARLLEFGLEVTVVGVYPGPVITRFELELAAGTKASKITGLSKDLARALSVSRVRVVEVIPGKSVVGLEIPNQNREMVRLREILESRHYEESPSPLTLALGKDISGEPVIANLIKMPHLLVAGTTGSGKSVGINAMLLSLLYKATPEEIRLILIDPKMLELSIYDGIPHLLTPVVTDMKDAASALRWCVSEMERRYQVMAALGVRNVVGYNRKILDAKAEGKPLYNPLWREEMGGEKPVLPFLPYIVVIIDEFADMMMVVGKKVEELIARIAQKARAAGIHMILATQRPSVDVITGLIKANVPTRIAFQVSSRIDSRTILDQQGAEQLLGHGDMLYLEPGSGIPNRIHGAFVSDEEVHAVVKALKVLGEPDYVEGILSSSLNSNAGFGDVGFETEQSGEQDELYDKAVQIVVETRRASISHLQRRLKIGYNRAATLIETMEAAGLLGPMQSNGARDILVQTEGGD